MDVKCLKHHDSVKLHLPVLIIPYPGFAPLASPAQIRAEAHILFDPAGTLTGKTLSSYRTGPDFLTWDGHFIFDGAKADRMTGDVVLAFNKHDYDGQAEYELFAPFFDAHGINVVHWFAGHYHLQGFEWTDAALNTDVSVVPSIIPATKMYTIEFDGSLRLNDQADAIVTPQDNLNGSMAVVHVNAPSGADCDGDGCTDFADFARAVLHYPQGLDDPPPVSPAPGPILNMWDLDIWAQHWLDGCDH